MNNENRPLYSIYYMDTRTPEPRVCHLYLGDLQQEQANSVMCDLAAQGNPERRTALYFWTIRTKPKSQQPKPFPYENVRSKNSKDARQRTLAGNRQGCLREAHVPRTGADQQAVSEVCREVHVPDASGLGSTGEGPRETAGVSAESGGGQ